MRISGYISGLLFLILLAEHASGQAAGLRTRGPRIGVDLAGLSLLYLDPGRMIYTASIDYEIQQDIYPAVELGYQGVRLDRDNYSYSSRGIFARAGADVNFLKYEGTDVYEMLFAGLRYGVSLFSHQADNITVREGYFGDLSGAGIPARQLTAHWISLAAGVRVELFSNFFMGWTVFANLKLAQRRDDKMFPYNVPGFGKGDKKTGIVINYTLAYRIPMQQYKPRKIIKKKDQPQNGGPPSE
jgi:hypothetical protein